MQKLLQKITIRNLLSFGSDGMELEMSDLNVLIGPNGSGKSNLLEAIGLFQAAPNNLASAVRGVSGGIRSWIWQGNPTTPAMIEAVVTNPYGNQPLVHALEFTEADQAFLLTDERVENQSPAEGHNQPFFYYRFQQGDPVINELDGTKRQLRRHPSAAEETPQQNYTNAIARFQSAVRNFQSGESPPTFEIQRDASILSQIREPIMYPELSYLGHLYSNIRLYREWQFGRRSIVRRPLESDQPSTPLNEDFSNINLFLNRLANSPPAKANLVESLTDLYEGLGGYDFRVEGGTIQLLFSEGDFAIPATRLSDGSLRYLCLLAILLDPTPPLLIGIEEPELGLHPDLLPKIADLLVAASCKTQLIVTTHSDILVDALSEHADSVIICEKHDGQTTMERLDRDRLAPWLENYRLGQLWNSGDLGGTRW